MEAVGGLAVKVLGGGAVATLGVGGSWWIFDMQANSISKYERALIHFLDADKEHDIAMKVKKVSGDNDSELSAPGNDFLKFSNDEKIKIQVEVSASETSTFKKGSGNAEDAQLKEIKDLNGGTWTWECQLSFKQKDAGAEKTVKEDFKNRVWAEQDKGLIGLLKKSIDSYSSTEDGKWTREEIRGVKKDFINKCGYARGIVKNRELNKGSGSKNEIKIEVPEFLFITESVESNLIPEDKDSFNTWFRKEYKTKEYHTA